MFSSEFLSEIYELERVMIFIFLLSLSLLMTRRWNGLAKSAVLWTAAEAGVVATRILDIGGDIQVFLQFAGVFSSSVFLWEILLFLGASLSGRVTVLAPERVDRSSHGSS